MLTVQEVMQRLAALKKRRLPYEPSWKDITNYILPRRSFWDEDATPGQKPTTKRYDGTALNELQLSVDGTLGNLVSASMKWMRLTMEDKAQNDIPWVMDWLEEVEDVLYAELARSNFYDSLGEFFLDGASIGTAVMLVDDDVATKQILFSARHIKECYLAEGRDGKVDTLYREFPISNRQMAQIWDDKLSVPRKQRVKDDPFGTAHVIHACFPRAEREPGKVDKYNKAWSSIYIDREFHNEKFLDEGGYDSFPYLAWRWRKNSDEWYGRSPAMDSIDDVLRLNQIGLTNLTVAQMAAQPPMNVPMAMKGQEKLIPKGYNYYLKPDEMMFPINLGQNYPITKDQELALKAQIKETFRTKMYMLLDQLEKGTMTATEVNARQGEKAVVQGPMMGRLNSECLIPLIRRTYMICERNGRIPPPPPQLAQGGRVHIDFQGPLAMQTKKYHQTQGVDAAIPFLQVMQGMAPESLDNVDFDELMRTGMDSKGAPQKSIREKPQVSEIRKMRQQAQAEQEQKAIEMEQQKMLAANANKLNEPVKPDSMLAGIGKAAQKGSQPAGPAPKGMPQR